MKLQISENPISFGHGRLFPKKCELEGIVMVRGENGIGKTQLFTHLLPSVQLPSIIFQKKLTPFNATTLEIELAQLKQNFCSLFSEERLHKCLEVFVPTFMKTSLNLASAGENQIAKIILSLCLETDWYMWDEPFQNLSSGNELKLLEMLKSLKNEGKNIFLIEHGERGIQADQTITLTRSERGIEWN